MKKTALESEVKFLKTRVHRVENAITKIMKEFEIQDVVGPWRVDPYTYARDDLDKEIIKLLLENKIISSTQIAEKLNENRFKIGKRLKRMEKESEKSGEKWLEFNPAEKDGHFRAWWLLTSTIKTELLQK